MTATIRTAPATDTRTRDPAGRLYFLDHLRVGVILLVVLLHANMTYMAFPPEWWYVIEPENSFTLTLLVMALDVANMQILFFIAGFFAYGSLEKAGPGQFMRQKLVRIGLPWVVGVVFLAPLVTYLIPLTRGFAAPYLEFWTGDFWGPFYQQSVYWFLGVLLLLFAILTAFYSGTPSLRNIPRAAQTPSARLFVTFWALTSLWFFVVTLVLPADTWSNALKVIVYQPARLLLYAGYFALGILADRRGWLRAGGFQPDLGWWGPATAIAALGYLGLRIVGSEWGLFFLVAQAALFNAFCLAGLMAGLAFFRQFANQPAPVWNSLSRNAYAIYYVHPLILYPAAYLALSIQAPIFVEVAALTLVAVAVSWALGALVLTRWPVLRRVF